MDQTPKLRLPYIMPAQAQKHVTHNEAIRALDAVVQLAVIGRTLAVPPVSPIEGDRYIVAAAPTGAWSGAAGKITAYQDGTWEFYEPQRGWLCWIEAEQALATWDGSAWRPIAGDNLPSLGINTTADTTNRLAVKSDAVLFSHDDVTPGTGSIQVKYNKKLAADTCTFLFQTNFSGRAEVGLTGDDTLRIKTSPDGVSWNTRLVVPTSGPISIGGDELGIAMLTITGPGDALMLRCLAGWVGTGGGGILAHSKGDPTAADVRLGWYVMGTSLDGVMRNGAAMTGWSAEAFTPGVAQGMYLDLETTQVGTATRTKRWRVEAAGHFRPVADNAYQLGTSGFRVSSIWAANGTIQTSDAREKNVAARIAGNTAAAAVDAIAPVMFRWKVGGYDMRPSATETELDEETKELRPKMVPVPKPGQRLHAGFLAQEVKAAMDAAGVDFGVWGLEDASNPDSRQWLRPDQLIPVLWAALRETRAELAALRGKLAA